MSCRNCRFLLVVSFFGVCLFFFWVAMKEFWHQNNKNDSVERILPIKCLKQLPCPKEPFSSCHFRGSSHFGFFIHRNQHQRPKYRWSNHACVMKRSLVVDAKMWMGSRVVVLPQRVVNQNSSWIHGSQSDIPEILHLLSDESWIFTFPKKKGWILRFQTNSPSSALILVSSRVLASSCSAWIGRTVIWCPRGAARKMRI